MASQSIDFSGDKLVCLRMSKDEDATIFFVHAEILTKSSPVFKAALEGPWIEKETKTYDFANEVNNEQIINRFLQWAYRGKTDIDDNNGQVAYYLERFQLAAFADKYRVVGLMNAMTTILCKKTPTLRPNGKPSLPPPEAALLAYVETPPGSSLRKIVLSMFLYHGNARDSFMEPWGKELLEDCTDLALDIATTLLGVCNVTTASCKHCNDHESFLVSEETDKAKKSGLKRGCMMPTQIMVIHFLMVSQAICEVDCDGTR